MSSTESRLMWAAIALSLLLVLALGTLAVYSVVGRDDADRAEAQDAEPTPDDNPPAAPDTAIPIVDLDRPVGIDCAPSAGRGPAYTVAITNRGSTTIDYVVSIELTLSNAASMVTSAEVPGLAPGEQREVLINAAGSSGRQITGCSIAAVQSDRRVLLANS